MSFQGTTRRRSGRAALPHPDPTLGEDAEAQERIRMTNVSRREPPRCKALHAVPGQVTLATTAQHRSPEEPHGFAKRTQRWTITRSPTASSWFVCNKPGFVGKHKNPAARSR
jgi:hypothetical protein